MTIFQSFSKQLEAVIIFKLSSTLPPTCTLPHRTLVLVPTPQIWKQIRRSLLAASWWWVRALSQPLCSKEPGRLWNLLLILAKPSLALSVKQFAHIILGLKIATETKTRERPNIFLCGTHHTAKAEPPHPGAQLHWCDWTTKYSLKPWRSGQEVFMAPICLYFMHRRYHYLLLWIQPLVKQLVTFSVMTRKGVITCWVTVLPTVGWAEVKPYQFQSWHQ